MIDISKALATPGWMISSELEWIAEQASTCLQIAEIGCWQGRTTLAMALNTFGTVYAIDTFMGSPEHQEELSLHGKDWLIGEFMHNAGYLPQVRPMRMTSVEAAKQLSELRFDLIFIDSAHDYESVKADILAWRPLLAPGGIFCGHDYGPGCHGVGVKQAVLELIGTPILPVNEIWVAP